MDSDELIEEESQPLDNEESEDNEYRGRVFCEPSHPRPSPHNNHIYYGLHMHTGHPHDEDRHADYPFHHIAVEPHAELNEGFESDQSDNPIDNEDGDTSEDDMQNQDGSDGNASD